MALYNYKLYNVWWYRRVVPSQHGVIPQENSYMPTLCTLHRSLHVHAKNSLWSCHWVSWKFKFSLLNFWVLFFFFNLKSSLIFFHKGYYPGYNIHRMSSWLFEVYKVTFSQFNCTDLNQFKSGGKYYFWTYALLYTPSWLLAWLLLKILNNFKLCACY